MHHYTKEELKDTAGSTAIILFATVLVYALIPESTGFALVMLGTAIGNVLYGCAKVAWKHYRHRR